MSEPASPITSDNLSIDGLFACCDEALASAQGVYDQARQRLSAAVTRDGRLDARLLDSHQFAAHGIAWVATYVEALRQMLNWARGLEASGTFGELERLMLQAAFGEYVAQLAGGIPMSQGENVRPGDFGLSDSDIAPLRTGAAGELAARGNTAAVRARHLRADRRWPFRRPRSRRGRDLADDS